MLCMLRLLKTGLWMAVIALGVQSAWGFALIGPTSLDPWQVPSIGFNPIGNSSFSAVAPGFVPVLNDRLPSGPKDIGLEYRRNIPVLFYSYDESFSGFFGSNGMAAIDQAFGVFNNLTDVSAYSSDLSEFPLPVAEATYQAQAVV